MNFVSHNGKIFPDSEPLLLVQNRSFKWGDGVFETMKIFKGRILLEELHFERFFLSLKILQVNPSFDKQLLRDHILTLCRKNNCDQLARIRLAAYRDENNQAGYTIEALPVQEEVMKWNGTGLRVGLYPFARKSVDAFANLKSANYLPYTMAALYAQNNGLDDVLVLNSNNAIADSCRANLFLIRNDELLTPALHQGCINGVMRRFVIDHCKTNGIIVHQGEVTEGNLLEADELFLTNAIQGIRWVQQFSEKRYNAAKTALIYGKLFSNNYYEAP